MVLQTLSIAISPDRLQATILIPESMRESFPELEEIRRQLSAHKVRYGIKEDVLEHVVKRRICNRGVVVAEGRAATPGAPGRIEFVHDISERGKPRQLGNGRVDLRDLQHVLNVKSGETLVRRIPPRPGADGVSVEGEPIPASPGKEALLKAGPGTRISDQNPDELVAAEDGAVVIDANQIISVVHSRTFSGDINYTTGNIAFSGDVVIGGTVRAGFSVRAEGNVLIRGSVEDAEVICGGDLTVLRGAAGSDKGRLKAAGVITVHHLEHFTVQSAADVIVEEDIVHSDVRAEKWVKARKIIGGVVQGSAGVEAQIIGAAAETRTEIDMGSMAELMHARTDMLRQIGKKAAEVAQIKETLFAYVRDHMDENGRLVRAREEEFQTLRERCDEQIEAYSTASAEIEKVEARIKQRPNPVVKAEQILPNTLVHCGADGKLIKSMVYRCLITYKDGRLVISKT